MTAMPVEPLRVPEFSEGVIDLFSGFWTCEDHKTKMKPGKPCAFCAVETNGFEILDRLADF
ncbi:hypothetical protein [Streptomyces sp. NPDC006477]|uniref:hypothetical protein n=1 Tax=Streptomyces sp. NPDC006477 TaxID=3364747 RepID=UPI0036C18CD6